MDVDLKYREATAAEIVAHYLPGRADLKVSFETFCRETYDPRTANGVRHIRRASSRIWVENGRVYGTRRGCATELVAYHYTLEGRSFVARLRERGLP